MINPKAHLERALEEIHKAFHNANVDPEEALSNITKAGYALDMAKKDMKTLCENRRKAAQQGNKS